MAVRSQAAVVCYALLALHNSCVHASLWNHGRTLLGDITSVSVASNNPGGQYTGQIIPDDNTSDNNPLVQGCNEWNTPNRQHRVIGNSTQNRRAAGVRSLRIDGEETGTIASVSNFDDSRLLGEQHAASDFSSSAAQQQRRHLEDPEHVPILGKRTRVIVRHDNYDFESRYRIELDPALASGILLKSLGAGDYILEKVGPQWFGRLTSRIGSGRSRSAIMTIVEIIRSFEDHGVVDIFSKYSHHQIFLSIVAYSGLQKMFEAEGLADLYDLNETGTFDESSSLPLIKEVNGNKDNSVPDLLDDLAHFAAYASAAYGWKLGFAMKGTSFFSKLTRGRLPGKPRSTGQRGQPQSDGGEHLHEGEMPSFTRSPLKEITISDTSFFLRKTRREESDVVAAEWRSDTHRPGYVIVRDPSRKTLVFAIRGTWSFQDVLTDLCCTPQTFTPLHEQNETTKDLSSSFSQRLWSWFYSASRPSRNHGKTSTNSGIACAHQGMLEAAQGLAKSTQMIVERELKKNPDFSLVIVGHSMGGGVAALLGTLWSETFPVSVYVYGPPCIAPLDASIIVGSAAKCNIFSIAIEGDPFGYISLGHIAELTNVLDRLCADKNLRGRLLDRTLLRLNRKKKKENSWWLLHTMRYLHANFTGEKMYPPGRLFLLKQKPSGNWLRNKWTVHEVQPQYFSHFQARPAKLDLSKHMPSLYEDALLEVIDEVLK